MDSHWLQARRDPEYLQRALTLAAVSVWRIDLRTRRIHFTTLGFERVGQAEDPAGIALDAWRETIHPDDRAAVVRAADEAAASSRIVDVVARYQHPAGGWRTLLTRRVAERDQQGEAFALAGISLDISDQQAERERADALAERTRLAAEALGVGFWSRDDASGAAYWDEQMYRIYGLDPLQGPPSLADWLQHSVHPQDQGRLTTQAMQVDAAALCQDALIEATFRVLDGPGGERWVQTWTRRATRGGRRLSYGMHMDVSARHSDAQRAQHEQARTQLAIEATGVGIWERNAQGHVTYWNEAMYRLRGLVPDDPRSPHELNALAVHPEDRLAFEPLLRRHRELETPYRFEFRVQHPDGSWRWLATVGRALRNAQGEMLGWAGVNYDVTERKAAERLQQQKLQAEQASREKTAFMAHMSHDLRTPMNAMLGFTQLLRDDTRDPPSPRQREWLGHIGTAGQQLMRLVDDLSSIAQQGDEPAPAPSANSLHVLYVEDNPVNLQLVRELLGMRPAVRLRTAETGQAGIAAARAEVPDLLLLDLQLPDMHGLQVMRALRELPALARCRIVALSADAMPEHVSQAMAAGFDDYWTKPIQFDRFLAGIDRLASERAASATPPLKAPGAP